MWNLISGNPICQKKNTIEAQKKHLFNLSNAKPAIDTKPPKKFQRSYLNNKYENQRSKLIFKDNQILLDKMMKIEKTETEINPNYLKKHKTTLKSLQTTMRTRENLRITQENQDLLRRLQSTLSQYRRELWEKNHKSNESYRRNLLSGTKKNYKYDYSELANGELNSQNYGVDPLSNKFYAKTHGNTNNEFFPKKSGMNKSVKNEENGPRPYTAPKALYNSGLPYIV